MTWITPDDKVEEEAYAAARRIAEGAPLVARWHKAFARRLADPRLLTQAEIDEGYACFGTEDSASATAHSSTSANPSSRGADMDRSPASRSSSLPTSWRDRPVA